MNFITENIEMVISIVGVLILIAGYIVNKTKNKTDDKIFNFVKNPILNYFKSIKEKQDKEKKDKEEKDKEEIEPTETQVK